MTRFGPFVPDPPGPGPVHSNGTTNGHLHLAELPQPEPSHNDVPQDFTAASGQASEPSALPTSLTAPDGRVLPGPAAPDPTLVRLVRRAAAERLAVRLQVEQITDDAARR